MAELKKRQVSQEAWSTGIETVFLLIVLASSYPYVYLSYRKTETFLYVPMFFLLNAVMLYSVVVMRFAIKRMPNLLVNENLVVVHVLLFTAVTALWIVDRVYSSRGSKTYHEYAEDQTDENYFAWFYASYDKLLPKLAYEIVGNMLQLFMLYMLHTFSIFEGFVYDPITGEKIPVLSMFQTAKAME